VEALLSALLANQKNDLVASSSKSEFAHKLIARLEGRISVAGNLRQEEKISTGISSLDQLLGGGLEVGGVSEWGMPVGHGSRFLLVKLLRNLSNQQYSKPILWTIGQPGLQVFASSWVSLRVNLDKVLFAKSFKPIDDLREAFLEPVFSLLIFDSPKNLSREEYAFIAKQAAKMKIHVCILQNYFLTDKKGNVWARSRINCKAISNKIENIEVKSIKGACVSHAILSLREILK
jgi:predicted ATP-dependent serine protease